MTEVFRRSPYDFDDQWIEDMPLELKQGDHVRVRCEYENPSDQTITYGESSLDEMCYFVGYAVGTDRELDGCIDSGGGASGIFPEGCGMDPPNDLGIGKACTQGGDECAEGQRCTLDIIPGSPR